MARGYRPRAPTVHAVTATRHAGPPGPPAAKAGDPRPWAWSRVTRLWREPGRRGSVLAGQHEHRKLPSGPGLGCAEVRGPRDRLRPLRDELRPQIGKAKV